MTTRGQINSNFYQIVDVDGNGNPTGVKANLVEAAGNLNTVQFNNANYLGGDANFAFYPANATLVIENIEANTVNANVQIGNIANANYANYANIAFSVDIANVNGIGNVATINLNGNIDEYLTGQGTWSGVSNVNFANTANVAYSVDVGNVVGIGNIATTNYNGNTSEVLTGGGTFVPFPSITSANYANFAGEVVNSSQPNITSVGTLSNLTVNGNITANYFIGDGSQLTNIVANVANTVSLGAQPNITSVGNLIGLVVTGNIAATSFSGDGSGLGNITAGNINGTVPSAYNANDSVYANYANFAGNVVNAIQSNITSVGTLGNLNVSGNVTASNFIGNVTLANVANTISISANATTIANLYPIFVSNVGNQAAYLDNGNLSPLIYNPGEGNLFALRFVSLANNTSAPFTVNSTTRVANLNVERAGNADVANSVAGANVSGQVANALVAGTVYANAQPNITSVGNLVSLNVTGNLSSGNATLGNLAVANFFSGDGGLLSNIQSANVIGSLPVRFEVKNTSGGTLTKGTPVYVTGTVGATTVVEVAASRADTAGTMGTVGLLESTLNNNDSGYALSVGTLTSIDTSTYSVGQQLYVGATGGITNTRPTGANIVQPIGTAARINASTGSIEVNIWDIYDLPNLNDGNIWVGNTGNGYPTQVVLSTANVGNANFASYANIVTGANQSNITSVGTLSTLNVTGNISSGANVTAAFFIGNGSQLTGISGGGGGSNISNGTSNVSIAVANGNVTFGVNGISNVLTVSDNTLTVIANGNITLSGTGSQISGANLISATNGNIGNLQLKIYEETLPNAANTSTSISPDVSTGSIFRYTANANFTMNTLTNAVAGTSATIIITQDATGNRILTSNMKYAGGGKILSTTANTTDIISVFYDGTTYYATLSKGYS